MKNGGLNIFCSHKGKCLLVPNTPVEVCLHCGMIYYGAGAMQEVERHCFTIQNGTEEPDRYIEVPAKAYT
jgi:YgiT-type zinc finger domain-containing protein